MKRKKIPLPQGLSEIEPVLVFLNADLQAVSKRELARLLIDAAKAGGLTIVRATRPRKGIVPKDELSDISFEFAMREAEQIKVERIAAIRRGDDPHDVTEQFVRKNALLLQHKARAVVSAMTDLAREPRPLDLHPLFEALNFMLTPKAETEGPIEQAPYKLYFPYNTQKNRRERYFRLSFHIKGVDAALFQALFWLFSDPRWQELVGSCPVPHCSNRFFIKQRRAQRFCSKRHRDLWCKWRERGRVQT